MAVFDAPELVADALTLTPDVRVFCDDWRDASLVDPDLLVEHPDDLHGVDVALSRLPSHSPRSTSRPQPCRARPT